MRYPFGKESGLWSRFSMKKEDEHMKRLASILFMLMVTVMCAVAMAQGAYTPGTYEAEAKGFGGMVQVRLTVDESAVTDIAVTGEEETPGIGQRAIEELPARIVQAGGTQIDGVSGATITSGAILEAAAQALAQAQGLAQVQIRMAPGEYAVETYGFMAIEPFTVKVTVDETSILDVALEGGIESVAMVRSIDTYLIPRILENQSVAVDAVCGATVTSNAVLSAAAQALEQALIAGGSDVRALSAFKTPEPRVEDSLELEVGVLVIGMGGSGCAAAMSAVETQTQEGMPVSVLAIDKAGRYGGTSAFCGEPMAVNAPRYKAEFNAGEDYMDGEALKAAWNEYTEGDAKMNIVSKFLDNSGETIDWLFYDHGFLFNNPLTGFGPDDVYRCKYQYVSIATKEEGRDYGENVDFSQNTMADKYFARMMEDYEELGGEYMLETEAYALIYDETTGRVAGAKARRHDGTELTIKAGAVVLATGGFAGSEALEEEFLSQNPYYDKLGGYWTLIGMAQNDGKMIKAALDIGAGTYNIDIVPMVHFASSNIVLHDYPVNTYDNGGYMLWYGYKNTWSLNDLPTALALCSDIPWVDADGERFVKEGQLFSWWYAGPSYYAVWSQDLIDRVATEGFSANISTLAAGTQGGVPGGMPIPEVYEVIDKLLAQGLICKADTVQALAAQMGVDEDALAATLESYNGYCESGVDEQFGKAAQKLLPLHEGPYYAIKGYSCAFSTVGGLDIDEHFNVLKADGITPIEGLYAVGNDAGGVLYSNKKPYVTYGGAALGWAFTSGRLSGIEAAHCANGQ